MKEFVIHVANVTTKQREKELLIDTLSLFMKESVTNVIIVAIGQHKQGTSRDTSGHAILIFNCIEYRTDSSNCPGVY